jgi:hypothetical protein
MHMTIATELLSDDVLIVVWDGLVSGDHWEAHTRRRLADDPTWPSGTRRLADITTFDPSALTSPDITTVVELLRSRTSRLVGTRMAIVASGGWELAREFERQIDRLGTTTIVFNEVKSAANWLGIDVDVARATITRLRAQARG